MAFASNAILIIVLIAIVLADVIIVLDDFKIGLE